MSSNFSAGFRAKEYWINTQGDLYGALKGIGELKNFLVSIRRYEDASKLRETEKGVEKCLEFIESLTIYPEGYRENSVSQNQARIYSNREIQEKIAAILPKLSSFDLKMFCQREYSKSIFGINFPLLLKIPEYYPLIEKREAVKDHNGINRWTLKYQYERDGFLYALTTQWYPWNDVYVEQWLRKQNHIK